MLSTMKYQLLLSAIILLFNSLQVNHAMIIRQPLFKEKALHYNTARNTLDSMQEKWELVKLHPHKFKDEPPNVPIAHIRNQLLYITVSIGNPPQTFKVSLNTGEITSDFWVISADCTTNKCTQHSRYNHNQSTTYVSHGKPFHSGLVSGYLSFDDIKLGQQLILNMQDFGEAVKLVGISPFNVDGMLSMGAQPVSETDSPLLFNLVQRKKIDEPLFGIYLASKSDTAPLLKGELILGGRDSKHYDGKLTHVKLTSKTRWQIEMDYVSIVKTNSTSKKIACKNGCQAVVDTATDLIIGPLADVNALNKELGAVRNPTTELSYINCTKISTLPDVALSIGGEEFVLTHNDYVVMMDSNTCVSGFVAEDNDLWILGGVLQQVMYIEFDAGKSRMGFAKSVY